MEISAAIADAIAVQSPALSRFLLPRHSPTLSILAASAGALTVDSIAPPVAVRSDPYRHAPRTLVRRTRRTRRRSITDDGGEDEFSGDGDGDDGPFGGGGGGAGWGSGGRWGPDWDGSGPPPSPYSSDPAFDFVYKVMCWIALSNCAHFAFKKLGRLLSGREKVVPLRLVPSIC